MTFLFVVVYTPSDPTPFHHLCVSILVVNIMQRWLWVFSYLHCPNQLQEFLLRRRWRPKRLKWERESHQKVKLTCSSASCCVVQCKKVNLKLCPSLLILLRVLSCSLLLFFNCRFQRSIISFLSTYLSLNTYLVLRFALLDNSSHLPNDPHQIMFFKLPKLRKRQKRSQQQPRRNLHHHQVQILPQRLFPWLFHVLMSFTFTRNSHSCESLW